MKKAFLLSICLGGGIALFWHAFNTLDAEAAWRTAVSMPWYTIPAFFLLTLAGFVLSAWRWKMFLPQPLPHWMSVLTLHSVAGFMMSYITPATLLSGEPVKIYLLHEHNGVSLRNASTSVVLDKFVELVSVSVFLFAALLMAFSKGILGRDETSAVFLILPLFVLCLVAVTHCYARSKPIIGWVLDKVWRQPFPIWVRHFVSLEQEVMLYFSRHRKRTLHNFLVGLTVWAVKLLEIVVLLLFLGIKPTILQSFVVAFIPMLTWLLPIPAGLGAMESSILALFYLFGWDAGIAGAYIIITRLRDLCFVGAGFIHTFRHGVKSTIRAIVGRRKTAV